MEQENMMRKNNIIFYDMGCLSMMALSVLMFILFCFWLQHGCEQHFRWKHTQKPEMPIRIRCYIDANNQNAIDLINNSNRDLRIDIKLENKELQLSESFSVDIPTKNVMSNIKLPIYEKERDLYFKSNNTITLSHPEYSSSIVEIKFEQDKVFTY
jgi:hypothetical protein